MVEGGGGRAGVSQRPLRLHRSEQRRQPAREYRRGLGPRWLGRGRAERAGGRAGPPFLQPPFVSGLGCAPREGRGEEREGRRRAGGGHVVAGHRAARGLLGGRPRLAAFVSSRLAGERRRGGEGAPGRGGGVRGAGGGGGAGGDGQALCALGEPGGVGARGAVSVPAGGWGEKLFPERSPGVEGGHDTGPSGGVRVGRGTGTRVRATGAWGRPRRERGGGRR